MQVYFTTDRVKNIKEMSKQNFPAIDLIVVNFYPFQTIVTNTKILNVL